jgi:DNA-binding transcriptional ArsR family regulator
MDYQPARRLGDLLKDHNIVLKGADAATAMGFTQVPNFLLKSTKLSSGDKIAFAMLLSYAWQNDYCFPGQRRLADDLGLDERSIRRHLKALQANGLLAIRQRGQGKTNIYELHLKPVRRHAGFGRTKMSSLDRTQYSASDRTKTSDPL